MDNYDLDKFYTDFDNTTFGLKKFIEKYHIQKDLLTEAEDVILDMLAHDCQTCDFGYGMEHYNVIGRAVSFSKKLRAALEQEDD